MQPKEWWPSKKWSYLHLLGYLLIILFFFVGLVRLAGPVWIVRPTSASPMFAIRALQGVALLIVVAPIRRDYAHYLGLKDWRRLRQSLPAAGATLAICAGLLLLREALRYLGSPDGVAETPDMRALYSKGTPLTVAGILLVGAIVEESVDRGLVMGTCLSRMGPSAAVVVSTFLFLLTHFAVSPVAGVSVVLFLKWLAINFPLVALAIGLGLYQLHYGSIYGCIGIHLGVNLCSLFLAPFLFGLS